MSKQGKRSSAKLVAWAVALCMILGVLSPTLMYAQVSVGTDIDGHWAQAQIERWIERGIVKGYEDGTFKPENPIKRCEFAALMNRTFGFVEKAKVDFSDIEGTEWFVGDIAKAVAAGYMIGDAGGTFRPDDPIARQEAALVLARIYELKDQGKKHLFKDSDEIASWSHWAVMAVVDAGLMEGYPDGTFGPKNPIKRSETVTVLDRLVAEIFTEKGVYGKEDARMTIAGNAHVLADGVEIQNAKITGDLLIAQSVGDGTVILDNVTVDGNVKVQGGGKESIILKDSKIGSLEVVKKDVRIVIIGSTQVAKAYVKAPSTIVQEEVEGEGIAVLTIEELIGEGVVTLSGNFEEVRITGEDANVVIPEGQVENLYIEAPEVVVELGSDATIVNLVVDEPAEVTGTGSITNATINASGTVIEPEPENITIPEGVTAVIAGEEVVGGEEPAAPPVGSVFVPVSAISVNPTTMTLYAGGATGKITATVKPSNATNKNVTWSSSNTEVATVANGVVTPEAQGEAIITATSAADSSKKASCTVTVEEPIAAAFEETGNVGIAPDTAGDAAGNIYAEFKLVAEGTEISLAEGNVEYIKVKVGDGGWANLTPNTDATLWFNVEAATGLRTFEVKTKGEDANVYVATLDWKEEINNVSFTATGREGTRPETEDAYVEFEILVDSQRVSLAEGAVKLIAQKADGKWVELEPNTDETLWFKKDKATGTYEFFVVTSAGVMYKATLEWPGEGVYDALAEVNGVEAGANYGQNERKAMRQALEKNEKILGLDLTEYNKITVEGRKDAVGWDLLANRPAEGYTVETLQSMLDEIVLTRQTTEASLNMVNAAESLTDIGFATMLLDRFKAAKDENYTIHSGLQVTDKITMLEDLVGRYNRLGDDGKAAVLAKIIEKRPADGFGRSQATTDALAAALTEVETEINARLKITSVTIADNTAYASTAAGEGNTVRVLGYGVGINLDANNSGKKVSDTTSIVIELYKDKTLLGQQIFKGFEKHANASTISGTIDAGGQYVATSWENSWSAKIDEIPTRAVAIVQYTDGIATAEKSLSFTDTKIFEAAEAVYALFTNPLDDVDELVLADGVTQGKISAASTLVEAVSGGSSHKTLFGEMITKANSLLNPDQGSEDNEETGNGQ